MRVGRGAVLPEAMKLINPQGRILPFDWTTTPVLKSHRAQSYRDEIMIVGALGKDFPALWNCFFKMKNSGLRNLSPTGLHWKTFIKESSWMRNKKACRIDLS